MKKLNGFILTMTMLMIGVSSYANTQSQNQNQNQIGTTLNKIITLAEQGEQMNLKKTAELFNEPDLYGMAVFDASSNDATLRHYYEFKQKNSPLKNVSYTIWLDMDAGFSGVKGSVAFEFKQEQCPTIADYEKATGTKSDAFEFPNSPDLKTGNFSTYTAHFIETKTGKSLMIIGCKVSLGSHAKLS